MTQLWTPSMNADDDARNEARLAALVESAPRKPWDVFLRDSFKPKPGEHIGIIGSTGKGKTVLQTSLAQLFPFVAVFATKALDSSMDSLIEKGGYLRQARWHRLNPLDYPRRVVWPDATNIDAEEVQREVFGDALAKIFKEAGRPRQKPTGWAVVIDELWFISTYLGLKRRLSTFLFQGRSLGHTAILATQRPFDVPTEVYDQSTNLFFFKFSEYRALQRLAEIQSDNRQVVRYAVPRLEPFQVLYVHNISGTMVRTRIPSELLGKAE